MSSSYHLILSATNIYKKNGQLCVMITGHSYQFFTTFLRLFMTFLHFLRKNQRFLSNVVYCLYASKNALFIGFFELYAICIVPVENSTYSSLWEDIFTLTSLLNKKPSGDLISSIVYSP